MSKKEKIKFDDLEKLTGSSHEPFTESDLLRLIGDKNELNKVLKTRRIEFFSTLFTMISESRDFHDKVSAKLKDISNSKQ